MAYKRALLAVKQASGLPYAESL